MTNNRLNVIEEMKAKVKDDSDMLFLVSDMVESCIRYFEIVCNMENAIKTMQFRLEGDDYRNYVQSLDHSRRLAHNSLIAQIRATNRLAASLDFPLVFEGDMEDREQMAEFAKIVSNEYFDNRRR